jgi:hypothetical protein
MNKPKLENQKIKVEKGKWFYAFENGVLGYALPCALGWSALMHFIDSIPFFEGLLIALVVWPLFGFLGALCIWYFRSRNFKKLD